MGQRDDHRVDVIKDKGQRFVNQADIQQSGVDDAIIAKDHFPQKNPDQIGRPERDRDQEQPQRFAVGAHMERHEIGNRKSQKHRHHSHHRRYEQRALQQRAIDRLVDDLAIIVQRECRVDIHEILGPETEQDDRPQREGHQQQRIEKRRADQ